MFLIFGINQGEKKLDFDRTIICPCCGKFGRLEVYAVYMYFSLFFIPLFKWRKEYFVRSACCGTVYSITKEKGKSIERGECSELSAEDLILTGTCGRKRVCSVCGYKTEDPSFSFCPVCGSKLDQAGRSSI